VREEIYRGSAEKALVIPTGAVVVPGARQIEEGWGGSKRLSLQTPVIVKYRDEKTDHATALERWLR
jgi:2,3,4,5-tetrahydropyridine-2-carboxylate N-succinyltransferase